MLSVPSWSFMNHEFMTPGILILFFKVYFFEEIRWYLNFYGTQFIFMYGWFIQTVRCNLYMKILYTIRFYYFYYFIFKELSYLIYKYLHFYCIVIIFQKSEM